MKKLLRESVSVGFIVLGILAAGLGLKGFLLPSDFIDGGVTGVSMLVHDLSAVPLPITTKPLSFILNTQTPISIAEGYVNTKTTLPVRLPITTKQ